MPEVVIKYKSTKALKVLHDLAKVFDMVIEEPTIGAVSKKQGRALDLPITFAKNPDVKTLAGIWQDRNITLEDLRKQAWGTDFEFCYL